MQAAGNQLFTGAAFADDEHRFVHFEKAVRLTE